MPDDVSWRRGLFGTAIAVMALGATAMADEFNLPPKTYYRTASVLGHRIFYREAGNMVRLDMSAKGIGSGSAAS